MAHILVVDDHPTVAAAITVVLRKAGHRVTVAHDGRAALALVDSEAWDLVVTDILMPELDGIGLLRALQSSRPKLPVLAISGGNRFPADLCLSLASGLGARAVLQKPFETIELIDQVDALLAS